MRKKEESINNDSFFKDMVNKLNSNEDSSHNASYNNSNTNIIYEEHYDIKRMKRLAM